MERSRAAHRASSSAAVLERDRARRRGAGLGVSPSRDDEAAADRIEDAFDDDGASAGRGRGSACRWNGRAEGRSKLKTRSAPGSKRTRAPAEGDVLLASCRRIEQRRRRRPDRSVGGAAPRRPRQIARVRAVARARSRRASRTARPGCARPARGASATAVAEALGRHHRPDRVRTGRPDADLEEVEDADHPAIPWIFEHRTQEVDLHLQDLSDAPLLEERTSRCGQSGP